MIREARHRIQSDKHGSVHGDVEAMAAPNDADHYVVIKKRSKDEE